MYIFVAEIRRVYILFWSKSKTIYLIIIIIIIIIELDFISSLIVSLLANKEKARKKFVWKMAFDIDDSMAK